MNNEDELIEKWSNLSSTSIVRFSQAVRAWNDTLCGAFMGYVIGWSHDPEKFARDLRSDPVLCEAVKQSLLSSMSAVLASRMEARRSARRRMESN